MVSFGGKFFPFLNNPTIDVISGLFVLDCSVSVRESNFILEAYCLQSLETKCTNVLLDIDTIYITK